MIDVIDVFGIHGLMAVCYVLYSQAVHTKRIESNFLSVVPKLLRHMIAVEFHLVLQTRMRN